MSIVASTEARIRDVKVTADIITAYLVDGRVISVPLAWSWRLSEATPAQRAHWELIGDGQGIHWPDIDEDISAEGMLHGVPAHRPRRRAQGIATSLGSRLAPPNPYQASGVKRQTGTRHGGGVAPARQQVKRRHR